MPIKSSDIEKYQIEANAIKEIRFLADMMKGNINRICVTNDLSELYNMQITLKYNVDKLFNMVYDLKFKDGRR